MSCDEENFSFKKDGTTAHTKVKLSEMNLSNEMAQKVVNNLELVAYELSDSYEGTDYTHRSWRKKKNNYEYRSYCICKQT